MAFANPQEFVKQLDLSPRSTVADFGAGSGAWTLALSKYLTGGTVYAIDIQKELLGSLQTEATKAGLANIHYLQGDLESRGGSKLADEEVDVVLIANILFQSKLKYSIALEAKRILKRTGQVVVIEWKESFGGIGPKAEDVVSAKEIQEVFGQAGFVEQSTIDVSDQHYAMIFVKG
ncbi:MAG: class I SAM-dependent methyltransferase [Candidatus Vogelbacteria bacterium]|nr:class I SAM-dependent methyltransferase [Candidatus Vogelbacteria bacterium]